MKRWAVRHSVRHPGRWLAYQTCNGKVIRTGISFRTWDAAMQYVDSKIRWHKR